MTRGSSGVFTVALALSLLAAGCSSHQAATPQSEPSTALSSSTATSTAETTSIASSAGSTSTAAEPTTSEKTSSTSAAPKTSWTAPDYGAAKEAVAAYLKVMAAYNAALMESDPAAVDTTVLDEYTVSPAHDLLTGSLHVSSDTAYRGTPDKSRVEVGKRVDKVLAYVLSDCPEVSPSWRQYNVKTGLDTPIKPHDPPPPYAITALVGVQGNTWKVLDISTDFSKTCTR